MTAAKAPEKGLRFYPASHRYKLDCQWVPGVTTLIKNGLPNASLKYWSARTVAEYVADNPDGVDQLRTMGRAPMVSALKEIPWQKRDDAGIRGTEVHTHAQRLVAGEPVDVPELLAPYVEGCAQFLDDWGIEPLIVERPLAHRAHWWAGTADLFAGCRDGRTGLFDYKTGSGIYEKDAFQQAAYRHAEFWLDENDVELPVPAVDFAAAVHLRPGYYEVIPLKADADVYAEFRHIAYVADAARRAKGNKTTPGYVGTPAPAPTLTEIAS